jgi:hypothetical protein|eukprot:scaffold1213_cov208-Alexandrium_tamarense.AAC.8
MEKFNATKWDGMAKVQCQVLEEVQGMELVLQRLEYRSGYLGRFSGGRSGGASDDVGMAHGEKGGLKLCGYG